MNLTDFSFPSGMPLGQKWAKHQQDGYVEALGATLSALCGPTEGIIVSGCTFNDITGAVSSGFVYLAREFFFFPGTTITPPFPTDLSFVIDDQPAPSPLNLVRFFNGVNRSPFRRRRVKLEVYTGADPNIKVAGRRYFADLVPIQEAWRRVGDAGQPAFVNSWSWVGGGSPVEFKKDSSGMVTLTGMVSPSGIPVNTYHHMFTLPAGYRPNSRLAFRVQADLPVASQPQAYLRVGNTGVVDMSSSDGGGHFYTLDGIQFKAYQ